MRACVRVRAGVCACARARGVCVCARMVSAFAHERLPCVVMGVYGRARGGGVRLRELSDRLLYTTLYAQHQKHVYNIYKTRSTWNVCVCVCVTPEACVQHIQNQKHVEYIYIYICNTRSTCITCTKPEALAIYVYIYNTRSTRTVYATRMIYRLPRSRNESREGTALTRERVYVTPNHYHITRFILHLSSVQCIGRTDRHPAV